MSSDDMREFELDISGPEFALHEADIVDDTTFYAYVLERLVARDRGYAVWIQRESDENGVVRTDYFADKIQRGMVVPEGDGYMPWFIGDDGRSYPANEVPVPKQDAMDILTDIVVDHRIV